MILSDNAVKVLERRYLAKDETGKLLEDPEGMFRRVAKAVAQADKKLCFTAGAVRNRKMSFSN